ncbi:MAG: hypothetical protein WA843_00590 [Candidatus Saccharimonadales bacterium]
MINKDQLKILYVDQKMSMNDIAQTLGCSVNRVVYWMNKHELSRRSISQAIYQKHNPDGDPFRLKPIKTRADAELYGFGMGLYWGEGNKANRHSVRLGNTDPALIRMFMRFLIKLCGVRQEKLRFSLQLFSDIEPTEALQFWLRELSVAAHQFYKPTVTISGSIGTYRQKSRYGVITIYFHNKKLRDILVGSLPP